MDYEEARQTGAAQDELRDDLTLVQAYGGTIPEFWTGIRFDGPDLVVLLTAPEVHRDRILTLVAHPDRVDIRAAPHSRRRLDDVHEQLISITDGEPHSWTSRSPGLERVQVTLHANENELAAQLHERFGDALEIRLGSHSYPLTTIRPHPAGAPRATLELPDLQLTTEPTRSTWTPGETIGGLLRMTNGSPSETLHLETGSPTTGALLNVTGTEILGGYSGAIAGVGRSIELAPGASDTADFLAGSDTLDPTRGAVLPPGDYLLAVRLHLSSPTGTGQLVATPIPIRLDQT